VKTKVDEWHNFHNEVHNHIENYCVPQHGDYPDKMIEGMSLRDIKFQIERYAARIGKGARGVDEAERDCLKMAHYACLLLSKSRS